MTMHIELVSPEDILFSGEATQVMARTTAGEIGFLTGHVPFIGVLSGKGPVRVYLTDGTILDVAVHSGFVEVSNNRVSILSDVAELPQSIDVARAQAAKARAEAALAANGDDADARDALNRASLRLQVAGSASATSAH
jgi:F-type H+-transporting ATPase subunit epsilon